MESKELLKYIYHIAKNNGIALNVTKLMKLMYFCDGVFLAYGKNIVNENAKAWEHGPVYPKAYKYICNKKDHNEEPEMYLPSTEEEIKECGFEDAVLKIIMKFKDWTARKLSDWSHNPDGAWAMSINKNNGNLFCTISKDDMRYYFKEVLRFGN